MKNKLDKIYQKSKIINIDNQSKIVIMSDCHRGSGDRYDNFADNKMIYEKALNYYYHKKFTYIELGDGDDMWEVTDYQKIINEYLVIFKILKKFHQKNRFIMIYGNHDICKKSKKIVKSYFYKYYNKETKQIEDLLNNLMVYESLILNYYNNEIFLIHGHQEDLLNSTLWPLSRFLVRHAWRILEYLGVKDPTLIIKNNQVKKRKEKKLEKWSINNNKILIAGHTHRPIYPNIGESLYFNDGSCIHADGITCLEIENGKITLVKWGYQIKKHKITFKREIIAGQKNLREFLK